MSNCCCQGCRWSCCTFLLAEVVNVDAAFLNADGLLIVVAVVRLVVGFPLVDLVVIDLFVVVHLLNVSLFFFSLSLFYSLLLFSSMLIMDFLLVDVVLNVEC